MKCRRSVLIAIVSAALTVLAWVGGRCMAAAETKNPGNKSKALVDYTRLLNNELAKGVTPSNNAAVPLLSVFRTDMVFYKTVKAHGKYKSYVNRAFKNRLFTAIGIKMGGNAGPQYKPITRFLELGLSRSAGHTHKPRIPGYPTKSSYVWQIQDDATVRPWSAKQFPWMAAWLRANRAALDKIVAASQLPHFYIPLLGRNLATDVFSTFAPCYSIIENSVTALRVRAMLELHRRQFRKCGADLLAVHRLARLTSQTPFLLCQMVGYSINAAACYSDSAVANVGWISAAQYRQYIHTLRHLLPFTPLSHVFNTGERFLGLDYLQTLTHKPFQAFIQHYRGDDHHGADTKPWSKHDLVLADNLVNKYYDSEAAVFAHRDVRRSLRAQRNVEKWRAHILSPADKLVPPEVRNVISQFQLPRAMIDQQTEDRSNMEVTVVALALAEYRAEHGHYPASLSDLVPHDINKLPRDPFTGSPLGYSLGRRHCRVWAFIHLITPNNAAAPVSYLHRTVTLSIPPGRLAWPKILPASKW